MPTSWLVYTSVCSRKVIDHFLSICSAKVPEPFSIFKEAIHSILLAALITARFVREPAYDSFSKTISKIFSRSGTWLAALAGRPGPRAAARRA